MKNQSTTKTNGKNTSSRASKAKAAFSNISKENAESPNVSNGKTLAQAHLHYDSRKLSIGIDGKKLEKVTEILCQALSDLHVLYIKTRNFHWNLVGGRFHTLHLFLEEQYKALEAAIDETAERTRMMGGVPAASMMEFLAKSNLSECEGQLIKGDEVIEELLSDHEKVIVSLRKAIDEVADKLKDAGTADFLTDRIKQHEQTAWMLRSHLE